MSRKLPMNPLWLALLMAAMASEAPGQQPDFGVVEAASFQPRIAPGVLASGFSAEIGEVNEFAATLPLPTDLGGYSVVVTDGTGVDRPAGMLAAVRPASADFGQVNFVVPEESALGDGRVELRFEGEVRAARDLEISAVAPALFTMNQSGEGVPAGFAVAFLDGGGRSARDLFAFDAVLQAFVPDPFELGEPTDQIFLELFGTGFRGRSDLSEVKAEIGGVAVPVFSAGDQGAFAGLDQINLGPLPRLLSGRELEDLTMTVDGVAVNTVEIRIGGPLTTPPPTIISAEPSSAALGATVELLIGGENLSEVTGIDFTPPDGLLVGDLLVSDQEVRAEVEIAAEAEPGERSFTLASSIGRSNAATFTVLDAPAGPVISNLFLEGREVEIDGEPAVIFALGFDFEAPLGNIVYTGSFSDSATIEVDFTSPNTQNRCRWRLAGAPLNFPGVEAGRFDVFNTPEIDEEDAALGVGQFAFTLVDSEGNRGNTLTREVDIQPVCAPDSPVPDFVLPPQPPQ